MWWIKKKEEKKEVIDAELYIGAVSQTTLEHNFPMIEREYVRLIKEKNDNYNHLNARLFDGIKNIIIEHLKNDLEYSEFIDRERYYRARRLTTKGEKQVEKLMKQMKITETLIPDKKKQIEIEKIKNQLRQLQIKYDGR